MLIAKKKYWLITIVISGTVSRYQSNSCSVWCTCIQIRARLGHLLTVGAFALFILYLTRWSRRRGWGKEIVKGTHQSGVISRAHLGLPRYFSAGLRGKETEGQDTRGRKIKLPRNATPTGAGCAREFQVNELICIKNEDSDDDGGYAPNDDRDDALSRECESLPCRAVRRASNERSWVRCNGSWSFYKFVQAVVSYRLWAIYEWIFHTYVNSLHF